MFSKSIFTSTERLIIVYITVFNPRCLRRLSCGYSSLAKGIVIKIPFIQNVLETLLQISLI